MASFISKATKDLYILARDTTKNNEEVVLVFSTTRSDIDAFQSIIRTSGGFDILSDLIITVGGKNDNDYMMIYNK